MDNLGAVAGPLLALALVGLVGARTTIALSIIPGCSPPGHRLCHPPRPPRRAAQRNGCGCASGRCWPAGWPGSWSGVSTFEFGNVAATLLILRASELLAPAATRTGDPAGPRPLCRLRRGRDVASIPAGRRRDRRCAVLVLVFGVGLFGLAYAGSPPAPASVLALVPWFVATGVAIGCVETAEHAAVAALAPLELRGSAFGLLAAVQSFGKLAASAIAGLLWSAGLAPGGLHLPGRLDAARPCRASGGAPRFGLTVPPYSAVRRFLQLQCRPC